MHVTISNLELMYIDRHLICDVNSYHVSSLETLCM